MLSEECQLHFIQAATLLKETLKRLMEGTVLLGDLQIINESIDSFIHENKTISKSEEDVLNETLVRETLLLRYKEVRKFEEVKAVVGVFTQMCQHFKGI